MGISGGKSTRSDALAGELVLEAGSGPWQGGSVDLSAGAGGSAGGSVSVSSGSAVSKSSLTD